MTRFLVPILLPADPANPLEAATKQYVDNAIAGGGLTKPLADTYYVNIDGDTMTGKLILPDIGDVDEVATVFPLQIGAATGYNMRLDTNEIMAVNNGVRSNLILQGAPLSLYGAPTNVVGDVNIMSDNLSFGSAVRQMLNLYGGTFAFGVQGSTLYGRVSGTSASGFAFYNGGVHSDAARDPGAGGKELFYSSATVGMEVGKGLSLPRVITMYGNTDAVTAPGCYQSFRATDAAFTQLGWMGWNGNKNLQIHQDVDNGGLLLMATGVNSYVGFYTAGVEEARFDPAGTLLINKTVANRQVVGHELLGTGRLYSSTNSATAINLLLNITDGVAGNALISFRRADVQIGSVTMATTSTVAFNTSSDRRLKNILGPVERAADRVKRLKVWHFAWKEDGTEQDGLIADEVQDVVPIAVTGEPDAVDEDGEIEAQQLDYSKLVPLLTAGLQEALARIEELEQQVAELRAA